MATEKTILCYGDSNTHGTLPITDLDQRGRLAPDVRWPGVMAAGLGPGWRIIEEGHGGRTTVLPDPIDGAHRNGQAFLRVALESHAPVDLVLLMLGTNDLKARFNLPASDIALGLSVLAGSICASDCGPDGAAPGLVVIAPPPILEAGVLAEMFAGGAEKSRQLAGHYAQVARKFGAGFVDAGQYIVSSPVDGIHYDAEQHAVQGAVMADAVSTWHDRR